MEHAVANAKPRHGPWGRTHWAYRPVPPLRFRRPTLVAVRRLPVLSVHSQYAPPQQRGLPGSAPPAPAAPAALARRPIAPPTGLVTLLRSNLMDKELITRTTGRRLGYIDQMYVDPFRLKVSTLYLRRELLGMLEPFRRSSAAGSDRVGLGNLVQIGDVVLVHDEQALNEPPGDESAGMVKLVGASVKTEDGVSLGKVRDYVFNPDNGAISTIVYDAFGLPVIPKGMLTVYQLGWQEIKSVGPTEVIVRRGAEQRALKERGGQVEEFVESGAALLAGIFTASGQVAVRAFEGGGGESESGSREDLAYAEWYLAHGQEWERLYGQRVPPPSQAALAQVQKRRLPPQQRQPQAPPPQRGAPRALPPPQTQSYDQVLQPQEALQAAAGQSWASQVQPAREAVAAGAAGWGGSNGAAAAAAERPLPRSATPPAPQPPAQPWPQQWQQGPAGAGPQGLEDVQAQGRQPRGPPGGPSAPAAYPQYPATPQKQQQQPPSQPARPAADPSYAQQAAWGYPPSQQPPSGGAQQAQQASTTAGPPTASARPAAVEPDAVVVAGGGFQPGAGRAPVHQAEFSAAPQARRSQAPQPYPQAPPPLPQQQW